MRSFVLLVVFLVAMGATVFSVRSNHRNRYVDGIEVTSNRHARFARAAHPARCHADRLFGKATITG